MPFSACLPHWFMVHQGFGLRAVSGVTSLGFGPARRGSTLNPKPKTQGNHIYIYIYI